MTIVQEKTIIGNSDMDFTRVAGKFQRGGETSQVTTGEKFFPTVFAPLLNIYFTEDVC